VRRGDGKIERFDSTTFLLGAVSDSEFDDEEIEIVLSASDVLLLVTDGVHEAIDRSGRQFGLERLQEALGRTPAPERWSSHLTQAVEQWSGRIGDDDVLVATVRTPSAAAPLPKTRSLAEDIEMETTLGMNRAPSRFTSASSAAPAVAEGVEAAP
jgi:serine/threonine protein phosphatase PrpC